MQEKYSRSLMIKACEWRNMVALGSCWRQRALGPSIMSICRRRTAPLLRVRGRHRDLLLYGASLDAQDNEGSTPLMLAIGAGTISRQFLLDVARNVIGLRRRHGRIVELVNMREWGRHRGDGGGEERDHEVPRQC